MAILQKFFKILGLFLPIVIWLCLFSSGFLYDLKIADSFIGRINFLPFVVIAQCLLIAPYFYYSRYKVIKYLSVLICGLIIVFAACNIIDEKRVALTSDELRKGVMLIIIEEHAQNIIRKLGTQNIDFSKYQSCLESVNASDCITVNNRTVDEIIANNESDIFEYKDLRNLSVLSRIQFDKMVGEDNFIGALELMQKADQVFNTYIRDNDDYNLMRMLISALKEINSRHVKEKLEENKNIIPQSIHDEIQEKFAILTSYPPSEFSVNKGNMLVTYQLYYMFSLGVNTNAYFNQAYYSYAISDNCENFNSIHTPLSKIYLMFSKEEENGPDSMMSADHKIKCNSIKKLKRINGLTLDMI